MNDETQGSWLRAGVHGVVIGIEVRAGERVAAGQVLLVQEAMKMEVPLAAPAAGIVRALAAAVGQVLDEGAAAIEFEAQAQAQAPAPPAEDPATPRPRHHGRRADVGGRSPTP